MADRLSVGVVLRPDSTGFREAVAKAVDAELSNRPVSIPTDLGIDVKAIREAAETIQKTLQNSLSSLTITPTVDMSAVENAFKQIEATWKQINDDMQSSGSGGTRKRRTQKQPDPSKRDQAYIEKQRAHTYGGLVYGAKQGRNKITDQGALASYEKNFLKPISDELAKLEQQSSQITEKQKQDISNLASDARKELQSIQAVQKAAQVAANKAAAAPKDTFDVDKWESKMRKTLAAERTTSLEGTNKLTDPANISAYEQAWKNVEDTVLNIVTSPDIITPEELGRAESLANDLSKIYASLYQSENPKTRGKAQDVKDAEEYAANLGKIQTAEERLAKAKNEKDAHVYEAEIADLKKRNEELLTSISLARQYTDAAKQQFKQTAENSAQPSQRHAAVMQGAQDSAVLAAQNAIKSAMDLGGGYDTALLDEVHRQLEAIGKISTTATAQQIATLNAAVVKLNENVQYVNKAKLMPVSQTDVNAAVAEFEKLRTSWSALFQDAGLADKYGQVLNQLKTSQTVAELDNAKEAVRAFKAEVISAGKNTTSLRDQLAFTFKNLTKYWGLNDALNMVKQVFSEMYSAALEMDKKVTDLQIASGQSRSSVQALIKDYAQLGTQLGATAVSTAEAADTFLRQGMSSAETNELIKDSMYLSKLGQIDAAEAAEALTTSLNGYKKSASEAIDIVDKLTAVDAVSASSAGGLATAIAETATSADMAGISYDRLIGYVATVKEVTQDADESVGTFFRTMTARVNNIKSGSLYDPTNEESLSDVETTLSGLGIKLRDSKEEFRSMPDVLDEVAAGWEDYSTVQQRAIAKAFAGTQQSEKFLTLMEHYDEALGYASVAANSAGTATEKYEAYLDSIEAKQEAFVAQFQSLSATIMNDDLIKGAISTGTGLLGTLQAIIDTVGLIPTLSAGVGIGSILKNIGQPRVTGCNWAYLLREDAA